MSGVFTVEFSGVATGTAQQDLFELVGHASRPYVVLGYSLSQTSEVGDAAEEQLLIQLKSGQSTSGSGGSSKTPVPTDSSGGAAGFTAEVNNTTKASTGTIVTHESRSWNVRGPCEVLYTQEQQYIMPAGRRCTLELASTPADSITINGTIWVQEIG